MASYPTIIASSKLAPEHDSNNTPASDTDQKTGDEIIEVPTGNPANFIPFEEL